MTDVFESVRVVDRATALKLVNLSADTWDRLERAGQTPPVTQLSERRIGYRVVDLQAWLDARRIGPAPGSNPNPSTVAA